MTIAFPVFLPDGRHFLYLVRLSAPEQNGGIHVSSLDGADDRRILPDVSGMAFAPSPAGSGALPGKPGHLLFVRDNTLMALPLDAGSGQPAGEVFPVVEGVPC